MIVVGFGFGGLFAAGVVLKLVLKEKSVQVGLNPLVVCSAALIFLFRVFVAFLNGFPLLLVFRLFTGFLPVDIL